MERLADTIGLLYQGQLKLVEPLDSLQTRFRKTSLTLGKPLNGLPDVPPTWLMAECNNRAVAFIDSAYEEKKSTDAIRRIFPDCTGHDAVGMTLREIFIALAKTYKLNPNKNEE